ncbi:MAG: fibronectin type III domain-containing protein, partial [Chitinophagaceae bacterium]|nr:fibronectin type III domain-containing protein [Chitinophagaceae bacterium]
YTSSLSVSQAGGAQSVTIYVMFSPTAAQSYNGNIPVGGAGAATIQVPVVASGINTVPSAVTGVASDLTNHSATLSGSISAIGCSSITGYGIEISSISGFADGTGMKVPASNISGTASFSSALDGLVQGATYYFKAYATNNGGTGYGVEQAFVVPAIGQGLFLYPVPAIRGQEVRVTMDNIAPGNYSLQFFNSVGQLTYQWNMNIQVDFINQTVPIPESLQPGTYHVVLVNHLGKIVTKSILIM